MGGDKLVEFEEKNYDWLCERFIQIKRDDWDNFVYEEYLKTATDFPDKED